MLLQVPELEFPLHLHKTGKRKFSDDTFAEFCRANPNLRVERNTEGEIIVMAPAGGEASHRNLKLTVQLAYWTDEDGRGEAFDSSAGFILPDSSILSPGASWVPNEDLVALTPKQRKGFLPLCPKFVVELRSLSDNLAETKRKMELWIENGCATCLAH